MQWWEAFAFEQSGEAESIGEPKRMGDRLGRTNRSFGQENGLDDSSGAKRHPWACGTNSDEYSVEHDRPKKERAANDGVCGRIPQLGMRSRRFGFPSDS